MNKKIIAGIIVFGLGVIFFLTYIKEEKITKGIIIEDLPSDEKKIESINKNIVMIDGIPYEDYKGYLMPPEPDPIENNKTIAGVDVNNNYIRDDIERGILKKNWSQRNLGNSLNEARLYQLLLTQPENFPNSGDLIMKLMMGTHGKIGPGSFLRNTPERKAVSSAMYRGFSGGVVDVVSGNDFTYFAYRDYKFENDSGGNSKDYSGYTWSMDFYKNEPFPIYNRIGSIHSFYYKGRSSEMIRGNKFWKLNYGKTTEKEGKFSSEERKKIFEENSYEELEKNGTLQRILDETKERLEKGEWNE